MRIFVIMPFADNYTYIYKDLIKETCENAGFDVYRADDLYSTRQILDDIVNEINNSDLVIADLTGNNPNVLYELGIAHGLNKPVQIITQSVDDLPFDLSSYRVFKYSMIIDQYSKDKLRFFQLIEEIQNSTDLLFGNPISDFLHKETPKLHIKKENNIEILEDENKKLEEFQIEKGYFDHFSEFQDTSNEIYTRLNKITEFTKEIGKTFHEHTEKINKIKDNPNIQDKVSLARRLLINSSTILADYSSDIEGFNEFVSQNLPQLRNNVEAIISYRKSENITEQQKKEYQDIFNNALNSIDGAISQTNNFAEVFLQFPNLQGQFTQQSRRAASALENLSDNFIQIRALYLRLSDLD
ncbi:MAG: hypothetical protein ACOWWH_11815 [Eubacteriaceae bacterium]